jgi:hypothetical protein
VVGIVVKVEMIFYSSGGWELGDLRRIACGGGANSMLQFRLERGGNRTKHYWKMKWWQQAHLGSMGKKRDPVLRRNDISQRRGGIGEEKGRR